jgi:hypothetical protein
MRKAVWVAAVLSLLLWSLLAWGAHLALSGSSDWLSVLSSHVVQNTSWGAWLEMAFNWAEKLGLVALWAVYGVGVVGLLSCAIVATLMLRLLRSTGDAGSAYERQLS